VSTLLVSDREREYTVSLLRGHWVSGRLTDEEFEERLAEAWRARFAADLWQALRALPVEGPLPAAPPARSATAGVSLALGILALCLLLVSFGLLFIVTLPLSVTAWALGREARRSGAANAGTAKAGEWLGISGTVIGALLLTGCAALIWGF
jgi:Domain of unknown function (DUF1707)